MAESPAGLQLDLLTVVTRLEQISELLRADFEVTHTPLWLHLYKDRVMTCDVPRLRSHLTPETLEWAAER